MDYQPTGGVSWSQDWDPTTTITIKVKEQLHCETSPYQKLEFFDSETYGRFFTLDGLMMVNEKDEFVYHEMISHVAMATNPGIKRILIIGGGDGGTSRELARYGSVEHIDMVELDERVVRLCQQYLPYTAGHLEKEDRIDLHFRDGCKFVEEADDESYDLIVVDSTDPIGFGEGLFTKAFYENCYRILSDDGILVNQHESPYYAFHVHGMKRAYQRLDEIFPIAKVYQYHMPTYPSGHWLFGFASKKLDPIDDHYPEVWESLHLKTRYYNSNIHKGAFALPNFVLENLK
ncbi:MAG: polyamine aminopropyltransferase [Clostridia bacterium]|nr:polyamine aminopropyltransferase [Clostridia bacterium]